MALEHAQLERLLCERLCTHDRVYRRHDDVLMLESPFTFPDGDHYPIYLSETPGGSVKLSDRGHTLMHVSYEHDVDSFHEGAHASLREQIVRETEIDEEEGIFFGSLHGRCTKCSMRFATSCTTRSTAATSCSSTSISPSYSARFRLRCASSRIRHCWGGRAIVCCRHWNTR